MGRAVAWFSVVTLLLVMTVWAAIMTTMYVFAKKPPASVESASTEAEIQRLQTQVSQKSNQASDVAVRKDKEQKASEAKAKPIRAAPDTQHCKLYVVEPRGPQEDDERFCETLVFDKEPEDPAAVKAFVHAMENLQDNEWAYFSFGPVPEDQDLVATLAQGLRLSDFVTATSLQTTDSARDAFVLEDKVYAQTTECDNFAVTKATLERLAATLLERFVTAPDAPTALAQVLDREPSITCVSAHSLA